MKIFYGEFDFKFNPFEGDEGYVLQFLFQHWKFCFRFKVAGISIRFELEVSGFNLGGNEIFQNRPERPLPPASFATGNETFPSANKQVRDVDYQAPPSTKFMHEWIEQ